MCIGLLGHVLMSVLSDRFTAFEFLSISGQMFFGFLAEFMLFCSSLATLQSKEYAVYSSADKFSLRRLPFCFMLVNGFAIPDTLYNSPCTSKDCFW